MDGIRIARNIGMALFAMVLDVDGEVHNHAQPVTWYTARRFSRA